MTERARLGIAIMAYARPGYLRRTLDSLEQGRLEARPQNPALASRAPKLKKTDGLIDWSRTAQAIWARWGSGNDERDGESVKKAPGRISQWNEDQWNRIVRSSAKGSKPSLS